VVVVVAMGACAVDEVGLGANDAGRAEAGAPMVAGASGGAGTAGGAGMGREDAAAGTAGGAVAGAGEPLDARDGGPAQEAAIPDAVAGTTGSGGAGSGGQSGGSGARGCGHCQPCFRCEVDTCEPDPSAQWIVSCDSAAIAPLKPSGAVWDSLSGPPPATLPDTICVLSLPDGRMRSTPLVMDSLMPVWKSSVTPSSGAPLTSKLLMSPDSRWRITLTDIDTTGSETVCTTLPLAKTADLRAGALTLEDVGSCTRISLSLTCLSD
jgi:hypothetical protein